MDKDQVGGKFDQAVGKAKQAVGDAVGSRKLANEGVADQVKGSAKETWGNVKDAAHVSHDRAESNATEAERTHRQGISQTVDNVRDKVNAKIDEFKDRERSKDADRA